MRLSNIIAVLVGLILLVVLMGQNFTVPLSAPDHAIVYVDAQKKIYYAPSYIDIAKPPSVDVKKLTRLTLTEAKAQNYAANETSVEKGYFRQEYRPLTTFILEKVGLAKPLPVRWNKDGSWNW
ncbi:MAG: hypothetical protein ACOY46_09455 [Bacillota bacterium]